MHFFTAALRSQGFIDVSKKNAKVDLKTRSPRSNSTKLFDPSSPDHLEVKIAKIFEGHNRRYRRFFSFEQHDQNGEIYGYHLNETILAAERNYDGVFILVTTRDEFLPAKVVQCYKNLQEVELLFDDLKHFVDIHPVRHRLEDRVRAHVFLCILALLLKRVFEIDCLGNTCVTEPLETVAKSKLVTYKVKMSEKSSATRTFRKVTTVTSQQQHYFKLVGVKNPAMEVDCSWWET